MSPGMAVAIMVHLHIKIIKGSEKKRIAIMRGYTYLDLK
jgi:hypothetical protein